MKSKDYQSGYREGIERAITLAKLMGIDSKFIEKLENEIDQTGNIIKFSFGESYLIIEESNNMGRKIIEQVSAKTLPILVFTRELKFQVNSTNVKIFYITYENMENAVSPTDLSRIDNYIRTNLKEKGLVYIDSIDYIYNQNQERIQHILKLISTIKDYINRINGILLISLDNRTLKEQDYLLIKKEFKNVLNFIK
jgi:Protein of unknown function (DUF835).